MIACANAVDLAHTLTKALTPINQLMWTASTTSISRAIGVLDINFDHSRGDARTLYSEPYSRQSEQRSVFDSLTYETNIRVSGKIAYLSVRKHRQGSPVWIFHFEPISELAKTPVVFRGAKFDKKFRLFFLNQKKWQNRRCAAGSLTIGRLPGPKWFALCRRWVFQTQRTSECLFEEVRNLRRDVFQRRAFAIGWLCGVPSHAHAVCQATDTKRSVAIHCAGDIRQRSFTHHYHIPSGGGDVNIVWPGARRKGVSAG